MTLFTIGMLAVATTFLVPFAGFLLSGTRFFERINARSVEHASERLTELKVEAANAEIHAFPSARPSTNKRAA